VKVGFGFAEETKPTMAYEHSMNFDTKNSGEFVEETIEMYLQNMVAKLFLVPYNKILELLLVGLLANLLTLENNM